MRDDYKTTDPIVFTIVAVSIFLFTSIVFLGYDFLNQTRQRRIMTSAIQTNALVSNLFPNVVRDRILKTDAGGAVAKEASGETQKLRLKSYLRDDDKHATTEGSQSSPIAEFFAQTTVLFAGKLIGVPPSRWNHRRVVSLSQQTLLFCTTDIAGFTAWSSVREPTQVFTLLETLYSGFDEIAHRRGVFKVSDGGED